ncbi:MAG TPA: MOSC N-terminal beta barrel domain-containing protein [Thermoplasmata archaeon]|nr:MOSC N-terminal beta barrel domain-containing protein [Thermoplasmata archaeon]
MGLRVGVVDRLWRYPVKSMVGEALAEVEVSENGLAGDRTYAVLDVRTGRVVSAKNPKRWPGLFHLRASYVTPPTTGDPLPAVRITFPDGDEVESGDSQADARLSKFLGADVRLVTSTLERAAVEEYTPPILDRDEAFGEFRIARGPFHDSKPIHVVTTATLARLNELYPDGRFDPRRFRPNILLETGGLPGFVEQSWIGRTLRIGSTRIPLTGPCARCVMTTLPQEDLPEDLGILETVVAHSDGDVGVKGGVAQGGVLVLGAPAYLE